MMSDDEAPPPHTDADAPPPPLPSTRPRHVALASAPTSIVQRRADGTPVPPKQWAAEVRECEAEFVAAGLRHPHTGALRKSFAAVKLSLSLHPFWRDTIKHNLLVRRDECGGEETQNATLARARIWFEREFGREPTKADVKDAIHAIAAEHQYHPVEDYLLGLPPWDGTPRVGRLLDLLDVDPADREISEAYFTKWLIGAVDRVLNPGAQHDYVLVIQGDQGSQKTKVWRTLIGKAPFCNGLSASHWKDPYRLHSAWVHELGELEGVTTKKEVNDVKQHVTEVCEILSLKYEVQATTWHRRFVFCGTTNRDDLLRDETGARRFWIITTRRTELAPIDVGEIEKMRDQVWAEALFRFRAGEKGYLDSPHLIALHKGQVAKYQSEQDPWTEKLEAFLVDYRPTRAPVTTSMALDAIGIDLGKRTPLESGRVGKILRKAGLKSQTVWVNGKAVWGWSWLATRSDS